MGVLTFIVLAICGVLAFRYSKTVRAEGILVPDSGLIRIYSPQIGRVTVLRYRIGDQVQAGATVAEISSERWTSSDSPHFSMVASQLQAIVTILESEKAALLVRDRDVSNSTVRQRQQIEQSIGELTQDLEYQQRQLPAIKLLATEINKIASAGHLSKLDNLTVQERVSNAESRISTLRLEILRQRSALGTLSDGSTRELNAIASRLSDVDRTLMDLRIRVEGNSAERSVSVVAPISGVFTDVSAEVGEEVKPDQVIATMIRADSKVEAEFYVPASRAGLVKPNQAVILKFHTYPYLRYGVMRGRVLATSLSTTSRTNPNAKPQPDEPTFRVRVGLNTLPESNAGLRLDLKPGLTIQGEIVVGEERLYQWLLEQFSFEQRR